MADLHIYNMNHNYYSEMMAVAAAVMAHVNAGGDFPATMTCETALGRIVEVIRANAKEPTWRFRPICSDVPATRADLSPVCELLHYMAHPGTPIPNPFVFDYEIAELARDLAGCYLQACTCRLKMDTLCADIPRVPHLFRIADGMCAFDRDALDAFQKSMPAGLYVLKNRTPRPMSYSYQPTLKALLVSDAVLLWTLTTKYRLTKSEANDLVVYSRLVYYDRKHIKMVAQQAVDKPNPSYTIIDHLIIHVAAEYHLDPHVLLVESKADGWTREDTLRFLRSVIEDGLMVADYKFVKPSRASKLGVEYM